MVLVNPSHTHKAKEFEDNSQTKNDRKDSRIVQTLVREGKYLEPILLTGKYGELRRLTTARGSVIKRGSSIKNKIRGIEDEYFPELRKVIKTIEGKTIIGLMKEYPFPEDIIKLEKERLEQKLKEWSNNRFGKKRSSIVWQIANNSIGVKEGLNSAKMELKQLVEELEMIKSHEAELNREIVSIVKQVEESKYLITLPAIGYLTIGKLLGETGPLKNYKNASTLEKLAGLNLIESSSGEKKSKKIISKRGQKLLRSVIYGIALLSIRCNKPIRYEYCYRIEVKHQNKMQAVVAIVCKMLRIIYGLVNNSRVYDETKVSKYYYKKENACEWVTPIKPPLGLRNNLSDTVIKNIGHPLPTTPNEVMLGFPSTSWNDTVRNDRVRRGKKLWDKSAHKC
jgi:transposase